MTEKTDILWVDIAGGLAGLPVLGHVTDALRGTSLSLGLGTAALEITCMWSLDGPGIPLATPDNLDADRRPEVHDLLVGLSIKHVWLDVAQSLVIVSFEDSDIVLIAEPGTAEHGETVVRMQFADGSLRLITAPHTLVDLQPEEHRTV